jgi:hypothetical protein
MSKFKIFCVLAIVALIAAPAFAEVQNVKVSGDLSARWLIRATYDLDKNNAATNSGYDFLMSTAEVQVDADLTDNVGTVVRLANQKNWGDRSGMVVGTSTDSAMDVIVDLANVTFKEFFYAPLTVTVGRQDLWFGKGFVIGAKQRDPNVAISSSPEYTVINSFDAIRGTLDFDPWKIDAVYSVIEEGTTNKKDDVWLLGANLGYKFDSYKGEAEGYYWHKEDRSKVGYPAGTTTSVATQKNATETLGVRGSFEPLTNATLGAEWAWQGGTYSTSSVESRRRNAMAFDVSGDYDFKDVKWMPTVGLEYIYYSGESKTSVGDAQGNKWNAWDVLYRGKFDTAIREFQNLYYATAMRADNVTAQVSDQDAGSTNEQQFIIKGSINPINHLKVDGRFAWFRMAEAQLVSSASRSKDLGSELDLNLTYDYTEDVSFGLLAAWFFPGKYWLGGQDDTATDLVGTVKVAF